MNSSRIEDLPSKRLPGATLLGDEELERYSRQILLDGFGVEAQEKLCAGRIAVIGVGGLGCAAAYYCVAAGVGNILLVDRDEVELSNLARQILHTTDDIGIHKVDSAGRRLEKLNPNTIIETRRLKVDETNIDGVVAGRDFVIDGTDSFEAKFLINDACVRAGVPFCHAGVLGYAGQLMTIVPGVSACYRCIFDKPPSADVATCSLAGVLGPIAGVIGTIEACECVKMLAGVGEPLTNSLLTVDARTMDMRKVSVPRNPDCPACGPKAVVTVSDISTPET